MRTLAYIAVMLLAAQTGVAVRADQAPVRDPRAQPSGAQPAGLIAGQVVAADTGQPLPGVHVNLSGASASPSPARNATTDAQGQFSFETLPVGAYTVTVTRAGYVESVYGQKQPGSGRPGTAIQLGDGQQIKNLAVPLAKGGVVTGLVADEFGFPSTGITVRAYRSVFRNGERAVQQVGSAQTDDRGMYRVFGLTPGEYLVVATPRAGTEAAAVRAVVEARLVAIELEMARAQAMDRSALVEKELATRAGGPDAPTEGYAAIYYPGTTVAAQATRLTIGVSEEKAGIDIALQTVSLTRISGSITGISPLPPGLSVYLIENGSLPYLGGKTARVGSDGRFSFPGVPPGQYSLTARAALRAPVVALDSTTRPAARGEAVGRVEAAPAQWVWAQSELTVSGQSDQEVALSLSHGMSISGTVVLQGASPPADLSRVRLSFLPIGGSAGAAEMELGSAGARVDAQGRFTATGLMPGRYRITSSAIPGFTLASVMAQGREVLDSAVEVKAGDDVVGVVATFSDRATQLAGTLQESNGQPATGYTVVVFADNNQYWTPLSRRIQAGRPASDGRYSFRGLPAGDYRIAAVVDPEPGQWFDPEFLRQLVAASTRLTLGDGETRTQDLRVGPSR